MSSCGFQKELLLFEIEGKGSAHKNERASALKVRLLHVPLEEPLCPCPKKVLTLFGSLLQGNYH